MNDPYRKAEDMTDYQKVLKGQREYFQTQVTKDVSFRLIQLRKLYQWIEAHEEAIEKALWEDLNKAPFEAYATEIGIVKEEIRYAMKHLRWVGCDKAGSDTYHTISIKIADLCRTIWGCADYVSVELSVSTDYCTACCSNWRGKLCSIKAIRLFPKCLQADAGDDGGTFLYRDMSAA